MATTDCPLTNYDRSSCIHFIASPSRPPDLPKRPASRLASTTSSAVQRWGASVTSCSSLTLEHAKLSPPDHASPRRALDRPVRPGRLHDLFISSRRHPGIQEGGQDYVTGVHRRLRRLLLAGHGTWLWAPEFSR